MHTQLHKHSIPPHTHPRQVRELVVGKASEWIKHHPGQELEYIVLDLPCTFFALRTTSALPQVREVGGFRACQKL